MATSTATAAAANSPAVYAVNRVITRVVEFTQSLSYTAAVVISMVKIPKGAVITDLRYACSFSAGVVTVNIGDSTNASAYGADVALSGAGVALNVLALPYNKIGYSYSAEDTLKFTVVSTSTPPANAKIKLTVSYTSQNGNP
jgi:hypothetical protein